MTATITTIQTEEKPKDWRNDLVISWKKFRESVGLPCDLGWGVLKKRMNDMRKSTDELTGEILIDPEICLDVWERQLEGFRRNEYAKKAEYPFSLFQKQFGTFNSKPPKIETRRIGKPMQIKDVMIWCEVHGNVPSNHRCEG